MSHDDFWEGLARGHAASTYQSSVDLHLTGKPSREKFTSVRELTDVGRKSGALQLPVPAGTMVLFAGDLGATLSMTNPPKKGMPGEVVPVKSAGGDVTSHDGMVFVKWADGVFRSVHAEFLRLATLPREASKREFVDSVRNRGRFPVIDADEYPPIRGMEGPFRFQSGRILYYDPQAGAYYDSKTDIYLDRNEKLASEEAKAEGDPCWEGYEMFGMKEKGGRKVPNCIPQKAASDEVLLRGTRRFRAASLGDLRSFLKVADGTLVHKSTKDLWSFKKDADGGLTVERMFDSVGKPLKA
jgi:hypothetical protein